MTHRKAAYPIADFILNRWSPRALSSEIIEQKELMPLFEAARWAQSSYNGQPWRFLYARRDSSDWKTFFNLLVPFNQSWCKNASYLIVVISRKNFSWNDKPSITHSFDTGAACQNMALQGSINGLVVHGMEGFDYERARTDLHIPDNYSVEAMFAVGKKGNKKDLPPDLQAREEPSDRNPISDCIFEGVFKGAK